MRVTVAASLAALVSATACFHQQEPAPPTPPSIQVPVTLPTAAPSVAAEIAAMAGSYQLLMVDGHAIPFAPVHPGQPANAPPGPEVLASTLNVRPNGTFVMAMSYRMNRNGQETFFDMPFTGSCFTASSGVQMKWDGAGVTSVTMKGDTLVMNNEGMLFSYFRRRR